MCFTDFVKSLYCYCQNGIKTTKGPGKRGHIVADTFLPTQMFPRLPACAKFVADTNFVSRTQQMFLILFRNILCPQQMFPSLRSPRNIMGNNVSSFIKALKPWEVLMDKQNHPTFPYRSPNLLVLKWGKKKSSPAFANLWLFLVVKY